MDTQEKFQAAMQKVADDRDLDLVIEHNWANTGWYSFQPREGFGPVLRFPFDFQTDYSTFSAGGSPGPLGPNPDGGRWSFVRGGDHDLVIARVVALLDGGPDTVRIVVLPDGQTYGPLIGTRVYEVPSSADAEAIEEALASGTLEGRELR